MLLLRKKMCNHLIIFQILCLSLGSKGLKFQTDNSENCSIEERDDSLKFDNRNDFYFENYSNTYDENFKSTDLEAIIKNLEVVKVSSNSITISWTIEGINATFYVIKWFQEDTFIGEVNYTLPDWKYTIKNLNSCTEYKIILIADNANNSTEVFGKTEKMQPSAPSIIKADPTMVLNHLALNISWKIPSDGSSCIKHYSVVVESKIHDQSHVLTETTNETNILITHLYACTSYWVTVRAIDYDNQEGLVTQMQSEPTSAKPAYPPKLINNIGVPPFITTSTTVIFNWHALDIQNNCSIQSVSTECKYLYTEGYGFEIKEYSLTNSTLNEQKPNYVRLVVDKLSPFTKYICWGTVYNTGGPSDRSIPIPVFTKQHAPSPPLNFSLALKKNFTFSWDPPIIMPGYLQKYRLTLFWTPLYPVPDSCVILKSGNQNISPFANNFTWKDGEGYSNYTAYIYAKTAGGWSARSSEILFLSDSSGVPSEVTNLKYETKVLQNNSNFLETILSWNLPCLLRGKLKYFEVSGLGCRKNFQNHTINSTVFVGFNFQKNDEFNINLGELKPEYHYLFEISARIHETDEKGDVAAYSMDYPAGIPPQPSKEYLKSITLTPSKMKSSPTSFEILLPIFPDTNGEIRFYAIIVSRAAHNYEQSHTRFNIENGAWPNISSWRESMEKDFAIAYQASEPYWTPYPNYILNYGSIIAVKVIIGNDVTCKDVSLSTKSRLYCNGPLKPDTEYEIRMRAFTNDGYADSPPFRMKTDAELSVILIIALVVGILLLGILAALLLARKSYSKKKQKNTAVEEEFSEQDRSRSRRLTMNAHTHACETSIARTRRRYES